MAFTACDQSGLYRTTGPVSREDIICFAHTLLSRRFRNRRKLRPLMMFTSGWR